MWKAFFERLLSPQTARFILALLAIGMAQYALATLMGNEIKASNRDALMLALGIILGLSKDAFSYYFGSTANRDDHTPKVEIEQPPGKPVPTTDET